MSNGEIKNLVNKILIEKKDFILSRIDSTKNNIIGLLEELKSLDEFFSFQIPNSLEVKGKVGEENSIDVVHDYIVKISSSAHQVDLINYLLVGINQFCTRTALFLVRDDKIVGWNGKGFSKRGGEISDEEIKKLFFSLSADTIFKSVFESKKAYSGSPSSQSDDHLIYSRFGGKTPDRIFVLPFFVKGKPQALIYADSYENKIIGEKEIEMISTVGGMSLDLLPLRQKILSKIKTRELEDEQEDKTVAEIEPEDEEVEVSGKVKENDPERLARVIINDIILYNVKEVENGLQNKDLYRTLKDTILQSKELYLSRFDDISSFERQLIETLAKGDKDALKGYKFETIQ